MKEQFWDFEKFVEIASMLHLNCSRVKLFSLFDEWAIETTAHSVGQLSLTDLQFKLNEFENEKNDLFTIQEFSELRKRAKE